MQAAAINSVPTIEISKNDLREFVMQLTVYPCDRSQPSKASTKSSSYPGACPLPTPDQSSTLIPSPHPDPARYICVSGTRHIPVQVHGRVWLGIVWPFASRLPTPTLHNLPRPEVKAPFPIRSPGSASLTSPSKRITLSSVPWM